MSENAFAGKPEPPTEADLAAVLGSAKAAWDEPLNALAKEFAADIREWKCHSQKAAWAVRVALKMRTVVWLSPGVGSFGALFIFGQKAMAALESSALSGCCCRFAVTASV